MTTDNLQARAHALIGKPDSRELAAVVQLLEVMVGDEQASEAEEAVVARSKEWFLHNRGIPFERAVEDLGFSMDEIRAAAEEPGA